MLLVTIFIYIFLYHVFREANNASVELVTFQELHKGQKFWYREQCQKACFILVMNSIEFELLKILWDNNLQFNPLSAIVALTQKPVSWFAQQISWQVSIWGQHWHLMG